jgi:sulfite reductase alpha subunit-like flavoprotein
MAETLGGQKHDRTALILYGSETGNSQDVAEELGRLARRLQFKTTVCEMDQVNIVCIIIYFLWPFESV